MEYCPSRYGSGANLSAELIALIQVQSIISLLWECNLMENLKQQSYKVFGSNSTRFPFHKTECSWQPVNKLGV